MSEVVGEFVDMAPLENNGDGAGYGEAIEQGPADGRSRYNAILREGERVEGLSAYRLLHLVTGELSTGGERRKRITQRR